MAITVCTPAPTLGTEKVETKLPAVSVEGCDTVTWS